MLLSLIHICAQSARAKPEAALAEGIRHRDERLLRCAHDERQNHDGDRKRTGTQRICLLYTSVVPSKRQLDWFEMDRYAFVHYGVNTYTDRRCV